MHTRKAILPDASQIHELILHYSQVGTLLPRTMSDLCENVRDFYVVEDQQMVIACGALHLYGSHLTEVRSIAVHPDHNGKGAGRLLIEALLTEAEHHHVQCVCLFTRIPDFFARFGFSIARRENLPDKIYKDCINCPKLHACDEVAMIRGELPDYSILGDSHAATPLTKISA